MDEQTTKTKGTNEGVDPEMLKNLEMLMDMEMLESEEDVGMMQEMDEGEIKEEDEADQEKNHESA
ncbi:MAG: hypothetical protein IT288_10995 [Bdellovibrionales bacterium]|nr:hypothetical protein [Bdellovibrionales bacterium]